MSGFAALMALSASQTRESQNSVQSALVQRQQREELKRKQQEEEENKERERQHALRLRHFEEEKRREEIQQRREEEQAAIERERKRREQEERDALRYGKKGKSDGSLKWPSANSQSRADVRRRRQPSDSDGEAPAGLVLTREEKRKRKEEAELRRSLNFGKRSSHSSTRKPGGKLPGGAIDVTLAPKLETGSPGFSEQSIKARISAIPNTLVKLNVVKRDTRTIDEILQDRAKAREAKILNGEEAREFNDWFGSSKKKEPPKKFSFTSSTSAPSSGANTPGGSQTSTTSTSTALSPDYLHFLIFFIIEATGISTSSTVVSKKTSASKPPAANSGSTKSFPTSKASSAPRGLSTDARAKRSLTPSGARVAAHTSRPAASTARIVPKVSSSVRPTVSSHKRSRSLSLSDSDPPSPRPSKKRIVPQEPPRNAYSNEIWKMFGKNRDAYVRKDVFSDDEDMEADASILEREEYERLVLLSLMFLL